MNPSVRLIIELNIRHFQNLLRSETDPDKRETVERLLAEEQEKLARLLDRKGD